MLERIEALEKQNRRMRAILICSFAIGVAAIGMGQAGKQSQSVTFDAISTKEVIMKDKEGNKVGRWNSEGIFLFADDASFIFLDLNEGKPALVMDRKDGERATLELREKSVGLKIKGSDSSGVSIDVREGESSCSLIGSGGKTTATLGTTGTATNLHVYDSEGKNQRVNFKVTDSGALLNMFGLGPEPGISLQSDALGNIGSFKNNIGADQVLIGRSHVNNLSYVSVLDEQGKVKEVMASGKK